MVDVVDKNTRSRMMSGIKGKNTKPELRIRCGLHKRGFRFRLHCKDLPGKPDLVFPKYGAVVFVNGCFWHKHECYLFKWPKQNRKFWREKLTNNAMRDSRNHAALVADGWKIYTVWECSIKGKSNKEVDHLLDSMALWLLKGKENQSTRSPNHDSQPERMKNKGVE